MLVENTVLRRREDWAARTITAVPAEVRAPGAEPEASGHPTDEVRSSSILPAAVDPLVLVVANDGTKNVVVAGPAVLLPAQPEIALSEVRQRLMRIWRRSDLPEKLLEFFTHLTEAETAEAVCDVVARGALSIVGGYDAAVLLVSEKGEAHAGLLREGSRFARPGVILGSELRTALGCEPGRLNLTEHVSHVAYVPLGNLGVLFLADRRSDRIFQSDDWEVLVALADQGERALRRVRKLADARELALYDALTGLANRRLMEVSLKQAWSAAQRGEGLALIMIDLDNFKEINDTFGHRMGDEVLKVVGETLRKEARGADVVVRYGGDEFLVIMPRGNGNGARALTKRLKSRLAGWVEFTAGIACYAPTQTEPNELIEIADKALYNERLKMGRGRIGGGEAPPALNSA
jgi:diguanylate cyclase (GGDEF)-like protein